MNDRTVKRFAAILAAAVMIWLLSAAGMNVRAETSQSVAAKTAETAPAAEQTEQTQTAENTAPDKEVIPGEEEPTFELYCNEYNLTSYDPDQIYSNESPFFPYWIVAKHGTIRRAWSSNYGILSVELVEEADDWDFVKLIPRRAGDVVVTVLSEEGESIEVPVHVDQKFVDEYTYMPVFKVAAYVAPVYEGEDYICGSISRDAFEKEGLWEMPALSDITITAKYEDTEYTGTEPDKDGFFTFIGTPQMEWGKPYTVTFRCGEAEYTVERLVSRPIEQMQAQVSDMVYTGEELRPEIIIKDGETVLTEGVDYTVTLSENTKVGRGNVLILGEGKYSGDKAVSFLIRPVATALQDVDRAKGGFTVKWESLSVAAAEGKTTPDGAEASGDTAADFLPEMVDGYMIQYSTTEDFSGETGSMSVSGAETTSAEVTGLDEKTVYYVRVRSYKEVDDYRYFSDWSEAEKVKTK
ncbi:MAG: fibronectin type III domain-containing protein [Mogibacterium sp.]|nr:fibronectin type III domain-containing protein [Mogibacterium sp.]